MLHGIVKPLMYTFAMGKVLRTPRIPGWTDAGCRGRDLGCVMQSFAPSCDGDTRLSPLSLQGMIPRSPLGGSVPFYILRDSSEDERLGVAPSIDTDTLMNWQHQEEGQGKGTTNRLIGQNMSHLVHGDSVIPPGYRDMGWFWYTVHMNNFIWRPGTTLAQRLADAKDATGLSGALRDGLVLGLHVRQGDSCGGDALRTGRQCSALADYMVEVEKLRNETGVSTIYLATDSFDVILHAASQFPSYTWLKWTDAITFTKQLFSEHPDVVWDDIIRLNEANNRTEVNEHAGLLTSIDLMLLAQCDFFVGKFTSNFFRIAYELKAAQCDCAPPFASLDAPWCFDYAAEAGTSSILMKNGTLMTEKFLC